MTSTKYNLVAKIVSLLGLHLIQPLSYLPTELVVGPVVIIEWRQTIDCAA